MQKSLYLLLALFLVFGHLCANDFIIGTGTSTENYVPVSGGTNYGWSKFLYTASEMQAAGFTGTQSITRISFQISAEVNNYVMNNQGIYMRASYDAQYASTSNGYPGTAGFVQVYSGDVNWDGLGWVEIVLDTPYSYNSNWGIEILWENWDGTSASGFPKFRYTSDGNYTAVYKNGSTFQTTSGTRYRNRPNIWFATAATDVPSVAFATTPTDAATDVAVTAKLRWNHTGGSPTGYRLWLGTNNPPSNVIAAEVLGTNSYVPHDRLDFGTTYYWRIVPFNEFGNAFNCPVWSFTTIPDPSITTFPYTQDFDGTFPPDAWAHYSGALADPVVLGAAGSSQWQRDEWLNISEATDKAAKMNLWGTLTGFLVSPMFNIPSEDYVLEFDVALLKYGQTPTGTPPQQNGTDDRFAVLIGDGYSWSVGDIAREWNNASSAYVLNNIGVNGQRFRIPLGTHTGRIRIAFYCGSTELNADNDFMINNVVIGIPEQGIASPQPILTKNPADNQLTLSWDAVSGATMYRILKADEPYGEFLPFENTNATTLTISPAYSKEFFKVIAEY